jgi:hypothetical protein
VPSLLGGWLFRHSVSLFIGVLTAYAFGLVGFVDDYIKVVKKRNLGLMARYKNRGAGAHHRGVPFLAVSQRNAVHHRDAAAAGRGGLRLVLLRPLVPPHHRHGERRQPDGLASTGWRPASPLL